MKKTVLLLVTSGLAAAAAGASSAEAAPTFYKDVLPVLQENCQTCHRPNGENIGGMIAPMALMDYEDTRPWAKAIAKAVNNRTMPPWFATEETRGLFHHERVLTTEQIDAVVGWVNNGAKAGDVADAPPRRTFVEDDSGGWSLGKPDLVVKMEEYLVADDIADININFHTPITKDMLPEDRWVRGIEFKVGSNLVHHMCASASPPGEYSPLGKFSDNSLGCIALGSESQMFPDGFAMKLEAGSTISFSMHYNKEIGEGSGFPDQSMIAFHFAEPDEEIRPISYDPIGNTTFEIPPGQERWKIGAARVFPVETDLLALWPHAHHRAVGARYVAFYPDGTEELLLDVPKYDQEWQTTYQYKEPKRIPAGTRVEVTMWFDNTEERAKERGFDSERSAINGTATTDEMMLGFVNYSTVREVGELEMMLGVSTGAGAGGGN